jgi:hypothetical protein
MKSKIAKFVLESMLILAKVSKMPVMDKIK